MDVTAELEAPCPPEQLFAWVSDLSRYTRWLGIVERVEPEHTPGPGGAAWRVDLRARVGPLSRAKRLRMVRTESSEPSLAVFERAEQDGRQHSRWVLRAEVAAGEQGSRLVMHLHYGGRFWGPVLERVLGDEIERSRRRLLDLATAGFPPAH